jgi:beclin 1
MGHRNGRPSSSEEDRQQLQAECQALRVKLASIRQQRNAIRGATTTTTATPQQCTTMMTHHYQQRLLELQNMAMQHRQMALDDYHSAVAIKKKLVEWLELAQRWNVTNDCFFIWHRGPYVTINGLRLGSELPVSPTANTKGANANSVSVGVTTTAADSNGNGNSQPSPQINNAGFKVPWVEINSALGITALLLSTLEQKPHVAIRYPHEIVPMGSTSKIGLRNGAAVTYYNLYSDDGFQFFGKRNFNIALAALLQCVKEAAEAVEKLDRTIVIPHKIEKTPKAEWIIGGLSILYGTDGEQWTRSMKYMLTDIKWLVAYSTKHVDR